MKRILFSFAAMGIALIFSSMSSSPASDGWIKLFDGKTLKGWKVGENASTFTVADGAIVVFGNRAHLFYDGPVKDHNFKNFEFKAKLTYRLAEDWQCICDPGCEGSSGKGQRVVYAAHHRPRKKDYR
jgi:hypothetical protein